MKEPTIESMAAKLSPKIEVKNVKHVFTESEQVGLGKDLARAMAGLRGVEAEFDQIKAAYKTRTAEAEARLDKLATDIQNGFEMRDTRCVVLYRPEQGKKLYIPEEEYEEGRIAGVEPEPALIEEMTLEDFQAEIQRAAKRLRAWLVEHWGKEEAKGFDQQIGI